MAVIINEIQITTTVGTTGNAQAAPPAAAAAPQSSSGGISLAEKQAIVAACVDEIMRMLQEKQER